MNKIINKIKSTLDKFMEIVGYNWVGYKVDIKALEKDIKALEKKLPTYKEYKKIMGEGVQVLNERQYNERI